MVDNAVKIVLIVGLIFIVIIIIYSLVTIASNSSALNAARQNLEDAITTITNSFTQFASSMFAGLSRFVSKLRDLLASFITNVSIAYASSITFLTNVFTQAFKYVEHLALQLLTFYATIYFKIESTITVFIENMTGKIATLPINVGLQIITSFSKVVSSAIHTAFCFAVNGIEEFVGVLQSDVVAPLEDFFTNPNNPIIVALENFLNANVVNPIKTIITDIGNLPGEITSVINSAIQPLAGFTNTIRCFLGDVCHHTPVVHCPSDPGDIFGQITIAGTVYGACF